MGDQGSMGRTAEKDALLRFQSRHMLHTARELVMGGLGVSSGGLAGSLREVLGHCRLGGWRRGAVIGVGFPSQLSPEVLNSGAAAAGANEGLGQSGSASGLALPDACPTASYLREVCFLIGASGD